MAEEGLAIEGESFAGVDFRSLGPSPREYTGCQFQSCVFDGADLARWRFEDCVFRESSFANTRLGGARLEDCVFEGCRLLGLNFGTCDQPVLTATFNACRLELCNFTDLSMKGSVFASSAIRECYFQNTYLSRADFRGVEFQDCLFSRANLEGANFQDAQGYVIDPTANKVRNAIFSVPGVLGLLAGFGVKVR